ncbi:MAG: glycoside hydrolase family 31 protein [Elusimicrobiales bacterium]|nr:glycoside hydrolase family 31 protein [Elusimicrobiales bacterium]
MNTIAKRFLTAVLLPAAFCCAGAAADVNTINTLTEIGAVAGYDKTDSAVTLNCADKSQVRLYVLAPDLVRVRASFQKPIPEKDHSWAIDKTAWTTPDWTLKEDGGDITLLTAELEVVVRRSPLLIEFRDARTHQVINSDQRPMLYDPKGTAIAAAKKLGFEEHFYGLGEKAARLDRRRGHFVMWNTDTYSYGEGTDPTYQSIPFYIGLEDGRAYGIFFDNSYRTGFDFGFSGQEYAQFYADAGEMNYYFFKGPEMKKIVSRYTELTGRMPLPPLWALGHQQCRWSYYPDTLVEKIVDKYRKDDLPLDAIYLDIHYMDGYRVFTWNEKRFPDPKGLVDRLLARGVKTVTIVDPGIKYQPDSKEPPPSPTPELGNHDPDYYVYAQGAKNNYYIKKKDGANYVGKVWPGESVFTDFTIPEAAAWWGNLHRAYTDYGIAGIWNDMNEPADFEDRDGVKQMDNVYDDMGEKSTHAKNRNVYAMLMSSATYNGLARLRPDKRPFVITRAAYAGVQRYAVMWTGDNTSTWDSLSLSIPMLQSVGLSGEAFAGSDIGGFTGGRSNGELVTRWYQVSFLAPFCRNHRDLSFNDNEPWRFGVYYEDIIRKYLKLRYRLLPFLYTALETAHGTGVPVFRPLVLNYQWDFNTVNLDDEFMVGDDLLAAPVLAAGRTSRKVYLPEGDWYDFWTGMLLAGGRVITAAAPLETAPMYVRAGAVIPMWPEMNYTGEKPADPVTFRIYPARDGRAAGTLYEDDGASPLYKTGASRRTTVTVSKESGGIKIQTAVSGGYSPSPRRLAFELETDAKIKEVNIDGKPAPKTSWSRAGALLTVSVQGDGPHSVSIR